MAWQGEQALLQIAEGPGNKSPLVICEELGLIWSGMAGTRNCDDKLIMLTVDHLGAEFSEEERERAL